MKYLAELLGTFILVFCGTGAIIINTQNMGFPGILGIASVFGSVVMVMVYALSSISGAHINPAVTIAAVIAHKFPLNQVLPYIVAQLIGAILASMLLQWIFPFDKSLGNTQPSGNPWQSFVFELIFTFILMLVILSVSTQTTLTAISGLAIGAVIFVGALVAGSISGGSFNPARSLGPAIVTGNFNMIWIYIVAPIGGSTLAALLWPHWQKQRD